MARRSGVAVAAAWAALAVGCGGTTKGPETQSAPEPTEQAPPPATDAAVVRTVSFENECPFDMWVASKGSNASVIACSPDGKTQQANCPDDFVCFERDVNTTYCVPGTTTSPTLPPTDPSAISLECGAPNCKSGACVTDTASAQWGQCTCTEDGQCPTSQVCEEVVAGTDQCFWGFAVPNDGLVAAGGGTASIEIGAPDSGIIWASGKFFAKVSCDLNGNCLSDNGQGDPASLIEYTFQVDNDWYDISYINGVNAPILMQPVMSTELQYADDDPYRCMVAGGTSDAMQAVFDFQASNGLNSNQNLSDFACTNAYDGAFVGGLTGVNFVTDDGSACGANNTCSDGSVCGLSHQIVSGGSDSLTCGNRLGYWTYAQLCGVNDAFVSTDLGVDCTNLSNFAYSLCKNQNGLADQGPGRSCFNANTTQPRDTCCGFEAWSFEGKGQPMGDGTSAVDQVDTSAWESAILPVVTPIKQGCPLAYVFQFDDPFATFTCATKNASATQPNATSYSVTFCPDGNAAGIDPPTNTCTPQTGSLPSNAFGVGVPSGITVALSGCTDATTCDVDVPPVAGQTTFETVSGTNGTYQVTATQGGTVVSCLFAIPDDGCIQRLSQTSTCQPWTIDTTGAWTGRNISIPSSL